jgi:hypothetical protein
MHTFQDILGGILKQRISNQVSTQWYFQSKDHPIREYKGEPAGTEVGGEVVEEISGVCGCSGEWLLWSRIEGKTRSR